MEGWITLHRKILDNSLWTCEPFSRGQAWVDLILLANHKNSFFYIRGIKVEVERGQFARSEATLAARWKWSRTKLRKFLNDLKKEQQIEKQANNVIQIITIVNYDLYQQKEPQPIQQKNRKKTAEEPQKDLYNNDNNDNNEENLSQEIFLESKKLPAPPALEKQSKKFIKPSLKDVRDYFYERSGNGDYSKEHSEKFHDFYESKGWKVGGDKMVSWKASVRNWIRGNPIPAEPKKPNPAFRMPDRPSEAKIQETMKINKENRLREKLNMQTNG